MIHEDRTECMEQDQSHYNTIVASGQYSNLLAHVWDWGHAIVGSPPHLAVRLLDPLTCLSTVVMYGIMFLDRQIGA